VRRTSKRDRTSERENECERGDSMKERPSVRDSEREREKTRVEGVVHGRAISHHTTIQLDAVGGLVLDADLAVELLSGASETSILRSYTA
tara:strand:- start:291 stop:560 length:270 start_codon:yes stop_codon:yes gene_type:complete